MPASRPSIAPAVPAPPIVLIPRSTIYVERGSRQYVLTPEHRLRAGNPLVRQVGAEAFEAERPLDFEDVT